VDAVVSCVTRYDQANGRNMQARRVAGIKYVRAAQRPNHAPLGQSRFRSVLRQSHDGRENLTGKERIPERLEGLRRCLPADNLEHIRHRNKAGARKSL
jgi:hypothetical protein